jgi:hypothetical protein
MPSTSTERVIHTSIYGHVSATPELFATLFGAHHERVVNHNADVAIFLINPAAGIDNETIENWRNLDEVQMPRMVVITVMDGMELDFDDAVMVANRVFDSVVTPYLVLHGENGTPIGTISLDNFETIDYSTDPKTIAHADAELEELVAEFREEYLEKMVEMEEGAFAAGILFPAIPVNPVNGLGIDIVQKYLAELPGSR